MTEHQILQHRKSFACLWQDCLFSLLFFWAWRDEWIDLNRKAIKLDSTDVCFTSSIKRFYLPRWITDTCGQHTLKHSPSKTQHGTFTTCNSQKAEVTECLSSHEVHQLVLLSGFWLGPPCCWSTSWTTTSLCRNDRNWSLSTLGTKKWFVPFKSPLATWTFLHMSSPISAKLLQLLNLFF